MMRKTTYLLFLLLLVFCFRGHAQSLVRQSLVFRSTVLDDSVAYSVYLPDGYQQSQRYYPAVYLLHGMWGSEQDWIQYGRVQEIVDKGIKSGRWAPMIIIMPDAGNSYYVNDREGDYRYEDMFFTELIPELEERYRIYGRKEMRAICGLSMGGFGSMLYAMKHTAVFSACAALSPAIRTDQNLVEMDDEKYLSYFQPLFGGADHGTQRVTDHWKRNNLHHLSIEIPAEILGSTGWYLDIGDEDFLYDGVERFHILWRDLELEHQYRVRDGGHTWEYWRTGLPGCLDFINNHFIR